MKNGKEECIGQITVIVIDDSLVVRQQVRNMLMEHENVEVVGEADDIAVGLSMIIEHNPNYVVLDISMPKGSGFQLLEYLKSKNIRSKVIMLTNYSEVCYRNQAEILGADYFFDKSNEFDKVLQVICQHSHI